MMLFPHNHTRPIHGDTRGTIHTVRHRPMGLHWCVLALSLLLLHACGGVQGVSQPKKSMPDHTRVVLVPIPYETLPGWQARRDDFADFIFAFTKSCRRLMLDLDSNFKDVAALYGYPSDWHHLCEKADRLKEEANPHLVREFIRQNFVPHILSDRTNPIGLFTGYYEASLSASWQPDEHYRYPIYGKPRDLVRLSSSTIGTPTRYGRLVSGRLAPYHTRREINSGAIDDMAPVLLWADSIIDVFFLHIQGSGVAKLKEGGKIGLSFAAKNGHPYTAIGKILIEEGMINEKQMSMQAIRKWMRHNPQQALTVMEHNQSYIFFDLRESGGPVGSAGVALTPWRSLAIDHRHIPYGLPLWLATTQDQKQNHEAHEPITRLMVAQDTGAAIKGVSRGDVFFGGSSKAADIAGRMQSRGILYVMLPLKVAERQAQGYAGFPQEPTRRTERILFEGDPPPPR